MGWPSKEFRYLIAGYAVLLTASYLDNVRGPILPILSRTLHLNYYETSLFLVWGSFGALFTMAILWWMSQKVSEKVLTLFLCGLGFLVVIATNRVDRQNYLFLAVALGNTIAGLGTICNLLVYQGTHSLNRSRFLCGLHVMYGLGSLVAPPIAAQLLGWRNRWQDPLVLGALPLLFLIGFVGWGVEHREKKNIHDNPDEKIPYLHGFLLVLTFSLYAAGEVSISMWMVSYLIHTGVPLESAANYAALFFATMGFSRLLALFFLKPHWENTVFCFCLPLGILFFIWGRFGWTPALALSGMIGPFFPLYLSRVSRIYPSSMNRLTVGILLAVQISLGLMHLCIGKMGDAVGIEQAYWLPALLLSCAGLGLFLQSPRTLQEATQ